MKVNSNLAIERAKSNFQKDNQHLIPDPYKKIATQMEQQFVQHMLEQMENTVGDDTNDTASNYYRSLIRNERAEMMTNSSGGIGIKQMLLDQIYPREQRTELNLKAYQAQVERANQQRGLRQYGDANRLGGQNE